MSYHDEAKHPRNPAAGNTGEFGPKTPTGRELADLGADDRPSSLDALETLTYSHANGDFDGAELGIDGVVVLRHADGTLHAHAYLYLDFGYLPEDPGAVSDKLQEWLAANEQKVSAAVAAAFPGATLHDDGDSWEDRRMFVDVTPAPGNGFPDDAAGVVDLARRSGALRQIIAEKEADEALFWRRILDALPMH